MASNIYLKTSDEIELMRESALVVSKTLGMLASEIQPGVNALFRTVSYDKRINSTFSIGETIDDKAYSLSTSPHFSVIQRICISDFSCPQ